MPGYVRRTRSIPLMRIEVSVKGSNPRNSVIEHHGSVNRVTSAHSLLSDHESFGSIRVGQCHRKDHRAELHE